MEQISTGVRICEPIIVNSWNTYNLDNVGLCNNKAIFFTW